MKIIDNIKEMIGRVSTGFTKSFMSWNNIFNVEEEEQTRPDYDLNKAIYKASIIKGSDGSKKGAEYIYGASFAKPIINAVCAFAFTGLKPPKIKFSSIDEEYLEKVNNFLYFQRKNLYDIMRFGLRDGDVFIRLYGDVKQNPKVEILKPNKVNTLVNETNINDVLGYEINHKIQNNKESYILCEKYLRLENGQFQYEKYEKDINGQKTKSIEKKAISFIPICHFSNEKDPGEIYGNSDYQNLYILFKLYHAVMENTGKGVIYNGQPTPVITGIKNMQKFRDANFSSQSTQDGKKVYTIKWNPNKMMLLGDGCDMKMVTIPDTVTSTIQFLSIIFYCIVQASETPEFVMGTAVASSKASVSEQISVIVNKAERKRADFELFLYNFIDIYTKFLLTNNLISQTQIPKEQVMIEWSSIIDDDKKLSFEIIKWLKENSIITDETALILSDIKIEDKEQEIKQAREEETTKSKEIQIAQDIYSPTIVSETKKRKK